jgi:hypothetical protein
MEIHDLILQKIKHFAIQGNFFEGFSNKELGDIHFYLDQIFIQKMPGNNRIAEINPETDEATDAEQNKVTSLTLVMTAYRPLNLRFMIRFF